MSCFEKQRISSSMRFNSERGMYLLEYAVVLFGVAVLIVGLSDVSRIYHARGAVRAGVTEGLRCLYPTDAGCSGGSANSATLPVDRFNARITGNPVNKFELSRINYNLSSAWFNEPILKASFESKALTKVKLTQPQDAYRQYQVLFPGVANAIYLLKTQELPLIKPGNGSNAAESILRPQFIDPETNRSRDANLEKEIGNIELTTSKNGENKIAKTISVSFTITPQDVFGEAQTWDQLKSFENEYSFTASCYEGKKVTLANGAKVISWPDPGPPTRCSYRGAADKLYYGSGMKVPIMLHVTGTGEIDSSAKWTDKNTPPWQGISGKVTLSLKKDGREIANLGGRVFSRGKDSGVKQWGSFVVRGAGFRDGQLYDVNSSYKSSCDAAKYSECSDYITMPLITVGEPYELSASIQYLKGTSVKGDPAVTVKWTGGKLKVFHPSFRLAHEKRACGYSSSPNSCSLSVAPMQVSHRTTDLSQAFSYSERNETLCARSSPSGYRSSISTALDDFRSEIVRGTRRLESISFWSNGSSRDKCNPLVSNPTCEETPREYMLGCEPEYSIPKDPEVLCKLSDYQSKRDTFSDMEFSYKTLDRVESRGGCTGEPFPQCAKGNLANSGTAFLGSVSNGCSEALAVNARSETLGPLYKNTCVAELPGFIKRYREREGIPTGADVRAFEQPVTPLIEDSPPDDSCREYRKIEAKPGNSWFCAERATYVVASACCAKYGSRDCAIELAEQVAGSGSAGGSGQLIEGARQRTLMTVKAAYPPAKMDHTCSETASGEPGGNDCLSIEAGPAEYGTSAKLRAAMRVPLALADWFGLKDYTVVEYEDTRVLERSMVDG